MVSSRTEQVKERIKEQANRDENPEYSLVKSKEEFEEAKVRLFELVHLVNSSDNQLTPAQFVEKLLDVTQDIDMSFQAVQCDLDRIKVKTNAPWFSDEYPGNRFVKYGRGARYNRGQRIFDEDAR